jgi:hypothetical protein
LLNFPAAVAAPPNTAPCNALLDESAVAGFASELTVADPIAPTPAVVSRSNTPSSITSL